MIATTTLTQTRHAPTSNHANPTVLLIEIGFRVKFRLDLNLPNLLNHMPSVTSRARSFCSGFSNGLGFNGLA